MGELISFKDYKKKRQEQEFDSLSVAVQNLIDDLGIEHTPEPYYPEREKNITLGLCVDSLLFCSDALLELGYFEHSNLVDNLIVQISKERV